jgi:hypothetical protein
VRAHEPHAGRDTVVVGDHHPALADSQVLVGEEAEGPGQAEGAQMPTGYARARRVGGVLEQGEPALAREARECRRLARMPAVGHRHDRARARRRHSLDRVRDEPGLGQPANVGEHRRRAGVSDRVDRGHEGHRRHDDFVARPEARGGADEV